jgi:hypothetical protein
MSDTLDQILVGLLCGYTGYWLRVGRESADRRRKFRTDIQNISDNLLTHENVVLLEAYRQSVGIIKSKCNEVWGDLFYWNRPRMERAKDKYCGFKDEEVDPSKKSPAIFFGPTFSNEERAMAWQESRQRLLAAISELRGSV